MAASILWAIYGPLQITDPQVLQRLTDSINTKKAVTVSPQNLNSGVDPLFMTVKWAVVYYRVGTGEFLSRAAKDGDSLIFAN